MLHAYFRAATLALLAAVAVLVYINYFHASGPQADLSTEAAAVNTPPELPKLAPNAEAPHLADLPSLTLDEVVDSPRTHQELAANSTAVPLAEVVELPSTPRRRTATAETAQVVQTPSGRRTHVVKPGESLWVISKKYFGNADQLSKIAESNGITTRDRIRAGQILVIPDLAGMPAQIVAQTPAANTAASARPAIHNAEADADHEEVRTVPVSLNRAPVQQAIMNTQTTRKY